ncbi:zinc ribbon domain-containing protein [Pseudorhodoferax sp. Leaf274]|uniref:zinc ribbon domain-containing protein n=1 Tax=Pseudorhodoferax sp. Leaf274 TaxID=1736318 RepID=UPI0007025309|nr:zinc ribbon domain-containing protein [Pseudorhodoferax sp. Leaf274]KQP35441.1 hypothetical protein ASF44_19040 [Pseudorhodoferax sp. Leaf274]
MALTNYTDVSPEFTDTDAGFQFEFRCTNCAYRWRSPLQPYRRGRLAGWLFNLNYLVSGARASEAASRRVAESGAGQARDDALAAARQLALAHFGECEDCKKAFCVDCFDADAHLCNECAHIARRGHGGAMREAPAAPARSSSPDCPNCGTASHGGRFCAECGFDMASTHKSCPGCGAMTERSARFCGDCGHGF